MKLWKSIRSVSKSRALAVSGAVLIISVIGAVTFAKSQQLASHETPAVATQAPSDLDKPTTAVEQATPNDQSKANPAPTQAPQSSPSSQAPKPTTQPAPTRPPQLAPFTISSVSLGNAYWACSGGGVIVYVSYAAVSANGIAGGNFTWQLEVTGAWNPPAPYPTTGNIPQGQTAQFLKGSMSPGFLYSTSYARDGESVRVHVTSPNDVASPWFTVPAGTQSSCANS